MKLRTFAGLALVVSVALFAWRCFRLVGFYRYMAWLEREFPSHGDFSPDERDCIVQAYAAGVCLLLSGIWYTLAQWYRRANEAAAP